MSSAPALFAMRYSGESRPSAFLAGSSDGNGLSVIAITGWAMTYLHARAAARRASATAPSSRQHLGIDDVRRSLAFEQREDVVDHNVRHLLAHFGDGAAEMRGQHHIGHLDQRSGHLGLVLAYLDSGDSHP